MTFHWITTPLEPILKDDPLFVLMALPNKLIGSKLQALVNYFFFVYMVILPVSCFLVIVATNQWQIFYSPYSGYASGVFIVWSCYVSFFIFGSKYRRVYRDVFPHLWSLDVAGEEHHNRLKKIGKQLRTFKLVLITLAFIGATSGLPWFGDDYDFYIPIKLIVDYCDQWKLFFSIFFYLSFYHIGVTVLSCFFSLMFLVLHLQNQFYLLKTRLQTFATDSGTSDVFLSMKVKDEEYNRSVTQEIVFCIRHHQSVLMYCDRLNDLLYLPIFYFTLSFIVTGVSVILFPKYDLQALIRSLFVIVLGMCMTLLFCSLGQLIENESENVLYSLIEAPWYLWNTTNRRLYYLFLLKAQDTVNLSSSGLITINFQLILTLYRGIYSALTFFLNFS
ncbi:odorant receptor 322 [Tribolium castaneum]|uniref:Odorant receptor n=1 Tax=Tribolium castaneum TaxID=7070 RepID=D6W9Y7_TRICA|nr:odorant receptor 322 [Tribolium castaneum]